jgi:hypothetical protein
MNRFPEDAVPFILDDPEGGQAGAGRRIAGLLDEPEGRDVILRWLRVDGLLRWRAYAPERRMASRQRCLEAVLRATGGLRAGPSRMCREFAPVPRAASRRLPRAWLASAAAATLAAFALAFLGWPAGPPTLAQEAMDRTAKALAVAQGLLVNFDMTIVRYAAVNPGDAARDEVRRARGEMRARILSPDEPRVRCRETWLDEKGEPKSVRTRVWCEAGLWTRDEVAGSDARIWGPSTGAGHPGARTVSTLPAGQRILRAGGSPVDLRDGGAVEGLIRLLQDFAQPKQLHWMDCAWSFRGGRGSAKDPFEYQCDFAATGPDPLSPFQGGKSPPARIVWTLRLQVAADRRLVDGVETIEEIRDAETGRIASRIQVLSRIAYRDTPWPEETFKPDPDPLGEPFRAGEGPRGGRERDETH